MFEAERMLLAETPFVPVYTYVTKRMVNPRLTGWQSNVMDHHYSKDMFFLKASSEEPAPVITGETGVSTNNGQEITETDSPLSGENDETVPPGKAVEETITEEDDGTDSGGPDA